VPTRQFIDESSSNSVRVRSPQQDRLGALLAQQGRPTSDVDGYLQVQGVTCAEVGDLAAANGITVHELFVQSASLEAAFMEMTSDSVEYHADALDGPPDHRAGGSAHDVQEARS
jgi:ABC-2 type transport system ATP-binding protein